ncbi:V-type sodium ATP synthase subunit C [Peptoniphilus sp. ING2-D1G]|nr:V-type sodium ATP synthase subunit C [Peptoniphilus sp. ING2-D1G]
MDREKFVQSSATVRVKEKQLLGKASMERIVDASGLEDALKLLNDSVYQENISKLKKPQDYEIALRREQLKTFKEVYELSPERKIVDLIANNYYYHNIKVLVKDRVLSGDLSHLYIDIGDVDWAKINKSVDEDKKEDNEFLEVSLEAIEEYKKSMNPQNVDILIDKLYFKSLKKIADELDVKLFKKYVSDLIDFTNISIFLRTRKQQRDVDFLNKVLIDGGNLNTGQYEKYFYMDLDQITPLYKSLDIAKYVKGGIDTFKKTGSLSEYEENKDNYFMAMVKEAKRITYGPEVIFAYLFAKEMEMKNIEIILISKLNGVESSFIRERLRDSYV